MPRSGAEARYFQSTRGRVVLLLRASPRTIEELADALAITDNAVRSHIAALERDGLVERGNPRPTGGKPAFTYLLAPTANRLFPTAYGSIFREFLHSLDGTVSNDEITLALRATGRRLALSMPPATGSLEERAGHATEILNGLGGLATLQADDNGYLIRGLACPLAEVVVGHRDACALAESLLATLVGVPVREACETGENPRCRFRIGDGKEHHPPTS